MQHKYILMYIYKLELTSVILKPYSVALVAAIAAQLI